MEAKQKLKYEEVKDCIISYSSNTLTVDDSTLSGTTYYENYRYWYPDWHQEYHPYFPIYSIPIIENKTQKAFSIVKTLMKNKLVKELKVKDFISLVDEITKIL